MCLLWHRFLKFLWWLLLRLRQCVKLSCIHCKWFKVLEDKEKKSWNISSWVFVWWRPPCITNLRCFTKKGECNSIKLFSFFLFLATHGFPIPNLSRFYSRRHRVATNPKNWKKSEATNKFFITLIECCIKTTLTNY